MNPRKRGVDEREAPIEEPRRIMQDVKPQVNGDSRIPSTTSSPPQQPPKKRTRYKEPPIWAQSVRSRTKSSFGISSNRANQVNGKQPATLPVPSAAPALIKSETNGHRQVSPAGGPIDDPSRLLGPWERSITGKKPQEQVTKLVADWLYLNVVSRNDFGELASRGVVIEIEAKLGQLIDKDTNDRYQIPVLSECILRETHRGVGFRSSMTEVWFFLGLKWHH